MTRQELGAKIIGLTPEEANALAKTHGLKVMEIESDGASLVHIANYDGKRAKVSTVGGKIDSVVCWG